jgi:hypothetical protein
MSINHADGAQRPTLRRVLDAVVLNRVVNDPRVRPWLGGKGELDLSSVAADPRNIALVCETGGFLLIKQEAGCYEVHSQFLPDTPDVVEMARAGFEYLFTATDCQEITSKVPLENKRAVGLARAVGLRERFRRPKAWPGPEGTLGDVSYQAISFDDWKARTPGLAEHGRWFHERLEQAKTQGGSPLPAHDDDDAHDRAVGASVLMFRATNTRKAVLTYNRWARLAGYQSIELLSEQPAIVDVRDAVIEVRGHDMEVILCR